MADMGAVVAAQLARFGQPCVIRWAAKGTGSLAIPAGQANSLIRIKDRQFVNAAGVLQTAIQGMMPVTDRNLQGATIEVGSRVYKVLGNTEKVYLGRVISQTVTLE